MRAGSVPLNYHTRGGQGTVPVAYFEEDQCGTELV